MPIAHCFCKDISVSKNSWAEIALQWAADIGVDLSDVTLNAIPLAAQCGKNYTLMVNLYLPSLWPEADVARIQESLVKILSAKLQLNEADIFVLTSIIQSGHVCENGATLRW